MTDREIAFIVGVDSALKTKQQEDHDSQSRVMNAGFQSKIGGR